ncbi:hypothetical protein PHMEG_0008256 [Phytophthora megakarya]|uniref:Uncharacterized protein n=1 Tax=Phytophthora megakarya TaxID=4795 RepID=A0A225WJ69_9STRA|nr:hypothetical protein PHMEG_0008256 [Phytophthora megakarya]
MLPLEKPSRLETFQREYAAKYALQVTEVDGRGDVKEVQCRMCQGFDTVRTKRKAVETQSWKGPLFRVDSFIRHLERRHEERWAIYQTLNVEEKEEFLERDREDKEKMLTTMSEIMANQRKSTEALQAMLAGMQADYMSLRQRELEVRERELKVLEDARIERQNEHKAMREREQSARREREEERKADHERFLALLQSMQGK